MDNKDIKIDEEEFLKQHKEEILKNGEYAKLEIIVGEGNLMPYTNFKAENVSAMTMVGLIKTTESVLKSLRQRVPLYDIIEKMVQTENRGIIEKKIKMKKMKKKCDNLKFYCMIIRNNKICKYNVLATIDILKLHKKIVTKKEITNYYELREFLVKEFQYVFWSRCEYEFVIKDNFNEFKIDIFNQIMMNIDIITEYVINRLKIDFEVPRVIIKYETPFQFNEY